MLLLSKQVGSSLEGILVMVVGSTGWWAVRGEIFSDVWCQVKNWSTCWQDILLLHISMTVPCIGVVLAILPLA